MKAVFFALFALVAIAYAAPKEPQEKFGLCDICQTIAAFVEQYIAANGDATAGEIEDEICDDVLGGVLGSYCKTFLDMFLKLIIQYCKEGHKPLEVCQKVGLC